jgi:hypothetical protein
MKKKGEYKEAMHQFFIDLNKDYDSVRREVFIQFGIPMKLVSQRNLWQSQGTQTFVWHVSHQEWFEKRICFIVIAIQLCFTVCH